jgi:hypothetical protein
LANESPPFTKNPGWSLYRIETTGVDLVRVKLVGIIPACADKFYDFQVSPAGMEHIDEY